METQDFQNNQDLAGEQVPFVSQAQGEIISSDLSVRQDSSPASGEMNSAAPLTIDRESQINLVVNHPAEEEITIDLVQVFRNMKERAHIYIWVTLLFMVLGVCVTYAHYRITKTPEVVYSAVTLTYEIDNENSEDPTEPKRIPVSDLTAPDGEGELDLSQITSSTVLLEALNGLDLSTDISLSNLQQNLSIQRVLSEESGRAQEILSSMLENKNEGAYEQMQNMDYTYRNTFVVSLTNGFGEEGSRTKTYLRSDELSLLLERVLDAWNNYLVKTYADLKLPDDAVAAINIEELDIPESVDQIREAILALYSYSDGQPEEVKAYRSFETGDTLTDLMARMQLLIDTEVEYLSAYVFSNGIAVDRVNVIDNYRYRLLVAETELKEINENTEAIKKLLDSYKNDQIFVASTTVEGEETSAQTVQTNTAYYNELLEKQVENEKLAAQKRQEIIEYESRIAALNSAENVVKQSDIAATEEELNALIEKSEEMTREVRDHMSEVFSTDFYNTMAEHSVALGTSVSFLKAASKKLFFGLLTGLLIGLFLWFIDALIPEFTKGRETAEKGPDSEPDKNSGKRTITGKQVVSGTGNNPAGKEEQI